MQAPHERANEHTGERARPKFSFESPLSSAELNTPAATLSLQVSPSDLTQPPSSIGSLEKAFSKLSMRSPSMPNLFGSSSSDHPPPDLHSKVQADPLPRNKTGTFNNVVRTFTASKALNQVLGVRDPEPFVSPPAIPTDLAARFVAGLQDYEQLHAAGIFAEARSTSFTTSASSQQGQVPLADIAEEKESPVRATSTQQKTTSANSKLTIGVPKYTSAKQAVATAQRYAPTDSDNDAADDTASQFKESDCDEDDSSWGDGSSTTLAASGASRPGSAASGLSQPLPTFPPRTSSVLLLPLPGLKSREKNTSLLPHSVSKKLTPTLPVQTLHYAPVTGKQTNVQASSYASVVQPTLKKAGSLPVLFPSAGAGPTKKEPLHNVIARRYARKYAEAHGGLVEDDLQLSSNTPSPPRITIQAPSPVKPTGSRKRAPSLTAQEEFDPPLAQRPRRDDTVGLPVLPLEAEDEWMDEFPGNTYALLTILLTWSHTMWTLYRRLHDPKLFSIHPAFAYRIMPPVRKQLVSVSFYDTTVEPHKEVRFLGPDDAAEMSYHEVDVFADPNSKTSPPASPRCNPPMISIKQTLGLTDKDATKDIRYMSMAHRAKTGEGRWCYVLIKGNPLPDKSTPPHVMLAWHTSAVTSTSDCLHTIYADDPKPVKAPPQPQNKVKHFASLQDLAHTLRSPAKLNFRHNLRAVSSSSELPPVDPSADAEKRESVTLQRTVIKLEKAGGVPLIEGFKVDVKAFRGWMEACGRGEGKVILWKEREGV